MKTETEAAIKDLAERVKNTGSPHEAMHLSQAALNLAHVLATIDGIEKAPWGMRPSAEAP